MVQQFLNIKFLHLMSNYKVLAEQKFLTEVKCENN